MVLAKIEGLSKDNIKTFEEGIQKAQKELISKGYGAIQYKIKDSIVWMETNYGLQNRLQNWAIKRKIKQKVKELDKNGKVSFPNVDIKNV